MDINSTVAAGAGASRGKSMQSIGQLAKMAVAEVKNGGGEVPKNAQGIAASSLARGADMESVLASLVTPPPDDTPEPAPDPGDVPQAAGDAPAVDTPDAPAEPVADVVAEEPVDMSAVVSPPVATSDAPDIVQADPDASAVQTVTPTLADDVSREALAMLFGQEAPDRGP